MRVPLTKDGLNANHRQDKDDISLHDRVNEAYRGELGKSFQEKTKKRINWVVSRVTGKKVLDVGCSQGIVPILLGKKGIKVTGVDIDQKVIDDAINDLEKEPEAKPNVTFTRADFLEQTLSGKYDSVIMSEVLEHTYRPEEFIACAFELTREDGSIVVTVPFGINDHPDHRQNFYLVELYGLISQYYDISDVHIVEKWIGFSGKRRKSKTEKQAPPIELSQASEEAFYGIERLLTTQNYELVEQLAELADIKDQLQKARRYASHLYRRNEKLEHINGSRELKIGKAVTYLPKKLYRQRHINEFFNRAYLAVFPNRKRVIEGSDLRYEDLYSQPRPGKFYLNRTISKDNPLRIAAIMDDFTYSSFRHDADIAQLSPEGWRQEIESIKPDVLFIESAWRGVDNLWTNKIAKAPQELQDIVGYCRSESIPTMFWNKEDPVHLAHFMKAASLFDFVFTTDRDSIPIYRSVLGHPRVYLLPFAAQPAFNNPIEEYKRKDKFNFAGSYYRDYKERCRNFDSIMEAALQFRGVDIYDRNFDKDVPDKFRYPDRYQKYIKGSLPYSEIDKAYKGYVFAITMNTIKYSSTMFARRALELVASNTITVGNYSEGVRYFLGDLTIASDDKDEITEQLKVVTESDLSERKYRLLGLRRVLEQHTYEERLDRIISKIFADYQPFDRRKRVSVIAVASSQTDVDQVIDNFTRQDYEDKELVIITDDGNLKIPETAVVLSSKDRNSLSDIATSEYIAVFDTGTLYGRHYLTDLVLATKYSQTDIIGKSSYLTLDIADGTLSLQGADTQYKPDLPIEITRALVRKTYIGSTTIAKLSKDIAAKKVYKGRDLTQSIDGFNIADSHALTSDQTLEVEGYMGISQGESIGKIYRRADAISADQAAIAKAVVSRRLKVHKTHKIRHNPKEA